MINMEKLPSSHAGNPGNGSVAFSSEFWLCLQLGQFALSSLTEQQFQKLCTAWFFQREGEGERERDSLLNSPFCFLPGTLGFI